MKVIKKLYMLIMSCWRYECKNWTVTFIVELMMGFSPLPEAALEIVLYLFSEIVSLCSQPGLKLMVLLFWPPSARV